MQTAAQLTDTATETQADFGLTTLLKGYRFRVAETAEEFAAALELRREVYCGDFGYDVPVPDEYDYRSYLLIAESMETGEIVGTMRVTPRELGPIESEEYFHLPRKIDSRHVVEISRFAIKRSHRKTRTFLPVISVGLFKLVYELSMFLGADYQVVCTKSEKLFSYLTMGFTQTGIKKSYAKLNGVEHELLFHEFRRIPFTMADNPFAVMCATPLDEVVVPTEMPPTHLVDEPYSEPYRMAANG
jgi:N-acyl-L-homoserine lactone synthetase